MEKCINKPQALSAKVHTPSLLFKCDNLWFCFESKPDRKITNGSKINNYVTSKLKNWKENI